MMKMEEKKIDIKLVLGSWWVGEVGRNDFNGWVNCGNDFDAKGRADEMAKAFQACYDTAVQRWPVAEVR